MKNVVKKGHATSLSTQADMQLYLSCGKQFHCHSSSSDLLAIDIRYFGEWEWSPVTWLSDHEVPGSILNSAVGFSLLENFGLNASVSQLHLSMFCPVLSSEEAVHSADHRSE